MLKVLRLEIKENVTTVLFEIEHKKESELLSKNIAPFCPSLVAGAAMRNIIDENKDLLMMEKIINKDSITIYWEN